jgi:hypothetical protein
MWALVYTVLNLRLGIFRLAKHLLFLEESCSIQTGALLKMTQEKNYYIVPLETAVIKCTTFFKI